MPPIGTDALSSRGGGAVHGRRPLVDKAQFVGNDVGKSFFGSITFIGRIGVVGVICSVPGGCGGSSGYAGTIRIFCCHHILFHPALGAYLDGIVGIVVYVCDGQSSTVGKTGVLGEVITYLISGVAVASVVRGGGLILLTLQSGGKSPGAWDIGVVERVFTGVNGIYGETGEEGAGVGLDGGEIGGHPACAVYVSVRIWWLAVIGA